MFVIISLGTMLSLSTTSAISLGVAGGIALTTGAAYCFSDSDESINSSSNNNKSNETEVILKGIKVNFENGGVTIG